MTIHKRRKPFRIVEAGQSRPGAALWTEPGVNDWFAVDQEARRFHGRSAEDAAEMARSYNHPPKAAA